MTGDPRFGLGCAGLVEAVRRTPAVLRHVHEVEKGVQVDAAVGGLLFQEVELVAGSVDERSPGPAVVRVAGLALVEGVGDHMLGWVDEGGGQPLVGDLRPGTRWALAAASRGRGEHIVRAARGRVASNTQASVAIRLR